MIAPGAGKGARVDQVFVAGTNLYSVFSVCPDENE